MVGMEKTSCQTVYFVFLPISIPTRWEWKFFVWDEENQDIPTIPTFLQGEGGTGATECGCAAPVFLIVASSRLTLGLIWAKGPQQQR